MTTSTEKIQPGDVVRVGPPTDTVPHEGWAILLLKDGVVQSPHKVEKVNR